MSERVLFVDDEENVLRSLKRLFFDGPWQVATANSASEGLEALETSEFAVVISDQRMPGMGGAEFLEKVKELSPNTVRIILTGFADTAAAMSAINKGGAYRYISKPWNDDELRSIIEDAVGRYRLVKENKRLNELTTKQNEELKRWSSELEMYVQQQTVDMTRQNQALNRLNDRLKKTIKSFIVSFSNLAEMRDKRMCNHSNNVALLSNGIGEMAGLADGELIDVAIAAQLHDIGKIDLSDIVLIKDIDELAPEEMEEYKKHPIRGQSAIHFVEELARAGVLIRHHHESYDGRGFPDGIKGDDIPLGSRIIAMADTFDRLALSSAVYRSVGQSLDIVKGRLRTDFDPGLYGFLERVVGERMSALAPLEGAVEIELSTNDLVPGMIVSRDVKSGTGLLLLGKGVELTTRHIEKVMKFHRIDPSKTGVFVKSDRKLIHN